MQFTITKDILSDVRKNRTSLGDHPAFPPEEEEMFAVSAISDFFESLDLSTIEGLDNEEEAKKRLAELIRDVRNMESDKREKLETLCMECVTELFKIPNNTINLSLNLVDEVNRDKEPLVPGRTVDFSFEDINDMQELTNEVYKRRLLNALTVGASLFYSSGVELVIRDLFTLDHRLVNKYLEIYTLNTFLLFRVKDALGEDQSSDVGKVEVEISDVKPNPSVKAEGILFPVLFYEAIKGVLELATSHGLPEDRERANYILTKADFRLAELWDIRLGLALWHIVNEQIKYAGYDVKSVGLHFLFMELASMTIEEFNPFMQEVFAKTDKGRRMLKELCEDIILSQEEDDFSDFVPSIDTENQQLNDDVDYFTPEELLG